jgi:hypothetical protein
MTVRNCRNELFRLNAEFHRVADGRNEVPKSGRQSVPHSGGRCFRDVSHMTGTVKFVFPNSGISRFGHERKRGPRGRWNVSRTDGMNGHERRNHSKIRRFDMSSGRRSESGRFGMNAYGSDSSGSRSVSGLRYGRRGFTEWTKMGGM